MENLNIQQRHEIYKRALKKYDDYNLSFRANMLGACEAVNAALTNGETIYGDINEDNFPELIMFKDVDTLLWLDHDMNLEWNDYEARSEFRKLVLNFCVEMTK